MGVMGAAALFTASDTVAQTRVVCVGAVTQAAVTTPKCACAVNAPNIDGGINSQDVLARWCRERELVTC